MSSLRRIAASRANGRKSMGPLTPEGKQSSSQNALRHGLFSVSILLKDESPDLFQEVQCHYFDRFQPTDAVEAEIVEEMVAAVWRHRRAWRLEQAALDQPQPDRPAADLFHRYESRLHLMFQRCLKNLRLVRSADLRNEQAPPEEPLTCELAKCKNEPSPSSGQPVFPPAIPLQMPSANFPNEPTDHADFPPQPTAKQPLTNQPPESKNEPNPNSERLAPAPQPGRKEPNLIAHLLSGFDPQRPLPPTPKRPPSRAKRLTIEELTGKFKIA